MFDITFSNLRNSEHGSIYSVTSIKNKTFKKICTVLVLLLVLSIPIFSQSLISPIKIIPPVERTIVITEAKLDQIIADAVNEAVDAATAEVIRIYELKIINLTEDYESKLIKKDADIAKLNVDLKAMTVNFKNEQIKLSNYRKDQIKYYIIDALAASIVALTIEHIIFK